MYIDTAILIGHPILIYIVQSLLPLGKIDFSNFIEVLDQVKSFEVPFLENKVKFDEESGRIQTVMNLLDDLTDKSDNASMVASKAASIEEEIKKIPLKVKKKF